MSIVRLDNIQSLVNIATGQGTNQYDPFNHDTLKNDGVAFLDQHTQAHLRRQHKILRKLIETIPDQMTFRWGQITLGENSENDLDVKEDIEKWLSELPTRTVYNEYQGVAAAFNQAQKAANETGNAALILMADDGQAPDQPLKKIKTLDGLFLADRWAIKPDVSGLAFGVTSGIQHYILTSQQVLGGIKLVSSSGQPLGIGNVKIHKSRVLWFRGEELSDRSLQMNSGCDDSVLEGVYRSFREYDKAIRGAGRMLVDFDIYVHYIKNYLERAMADGSEAKVFERKMQQRLQANSLSRSSWRGMTADLDEEKIETITRNVSGYGDLIDRILADFLSNTDLQPSELLQKYPGGLANTGKAEQQNCNDRTRLYQSNKFDSNIRKIIKIGFLLKGKEPKVWDWDWNELSPTTPLEQSELELNWAQIDSSRIQAGVYSPDDAAKSHYSTTDFNPNISIDFKERERLQKEAEEQALAAAQEGADPSVEEQDPGADPSSEEQDPELVFDSADPLVPPKIVQDAAKQGMLIRRSLSDGAVPVRFAILGRKLSMGDSLSDFERTSLIAYHQSHRKSPAVLKADAETAIYLLHGGAGGQQWVAQLSAPGFRTDGMGDAPNFRDSGQRACGNCVHFETKGRNNAGWEGCGLYGFRTSRRSLCDSYKAMYASLAPEPQSTAQMELLRLENENLKMRLALSERDDGERMDKPCGEGFIKNLFKCGKSIPIPSDAPKSGLYSRIIFEPLKDYLGPAAAEESKKRKNPVNLRKNLLKDWDGMGWGENSERDGRNTAFVALEAQDPKYGLIETRSADKDHTPTGYLRFNRSGEEFLAIDHIGSDPNFKGSGTAAVNKLKEYAIAQGRGVSVNGAGESAKGFYEKVGFQKGKHHDFEIPYETLVKEMEGNFSAKRADDDTPIKRTIFWKGFEIGLQYQPFDLRHEKLLPCGYGEIVGTNGQDGMALDCYVGSALESDRVFVVDQLRAETGEFDEHKLFIGFSDDAPAIKDLFVSLMGQERFGGIRETVPAKVWDLHEDSEHFDQAQPQVDAEDVLDDFDTNIDADEILLDWGENAGVFSEVLNAE
jgi:GNAT superfamily N-acetyltransferase